MMSPVCALNVDHGIYQKTKTKKGHPDEIMVWGIVREAPVNPEIHLLGKNVPHRRCPTGVVAYLS